MTQEMKALQELSDALSTLVKSQAMSYVKGEIIKRSIFAGLMNSLAPVALLQIGQIIGASPVLDHCITYG